MIRIVFDKGNNKSIAYDENIEIGECDFIENNDFWNIIHTEVNESHKGQGIAKKLVECIIENSKIYNKKLEATCSYARKIIYRN